MSKKKLESFATSERIDFALSDIDLKSNNAKKVLLAEYDEELFGTYSSALLEYGFEIIGARNGSEAVSKFIKERPDIVLLDYDLPSLMSDGHETASEIMGMKPSAVLIIFSKSALVDKKVETINPELILQHQLATIKLVTSVVAVASVHPTMTLVPR